MRRVLSAFLTLAACAALAHAQDGAEPAPKTDDAPAVKNDAKPEITHKVLAEGEGEVVGDGRVAEVHYIGRLTDGKKFDSSRDRGDTFVFEVGKGAVIKGWDVTVAKMRVGDRWSVTIPWQMAYGEKGSPPVIPAKADLVFDIEVISIPTAEVEVITAGTGTKFEKDDLVELHMAISSEDDKELFSTRTKGQPTMQQVGAPSRIKGIGIELAKLRGGDHVKVKLPAALAFGKKGAPGEVEPNAPIFIEFEILNVIRPTYETITEGAGEPPKRGQTVKVHYVGTFKDGKQFDSSRDRGEAFEATVGRGIIPGWSWMLARMKPGQRVKVTIPWQMAYGAKGGRGMPPKSDLIFDMELLEVVK